jgi:ribosomal protein S18 acetylase RimI-like enzyme
LERLIVSPLESPSGAKLFEAAEANFVTHAGWLPRLQPGMRVIDESDLLLIDSGLPCDTFNLICRARLGAVEAPDRARAALDYFRRAERPFSWWVGPADRPRTLGDVLLGLGLERADTELGMVADLSGLGGEGLAPPGLRIARVRSEPELRAFGRVLAANWTPPDPLVIRFYELTASALLRDSTPLWLYVGYLGEVPVVTAELTVGGGLVGLYNVSTLAAHRGRGFGSALALRPLLDARERGYRTAILQAVREAAHLYEGLGFRSFCEITEYKPMSREAGPSNDKR